MLAYAHINLLSMLQRFEPEDAVRVATDSIYVRKSALHKLEGVKAYVAPKRCDCGEVACDYLPLVAPAQWRDKDEELYMPVEHAAYLAKPDYKAAKKDLTPSTAPGHDDPLSRHRLSYLSGGGGSGKTTRAIELFRQRDPLVFTPTHRLAKEMRARGVQAQTYHSFFRWSGQTEWTPERMGRKFIPRVIIWDEVCTVPRPTLETFLDWLEGRGVQVICCGDQGQPPPITGEMPHDWLRAVAQQPANYYEEVEVDHRAKDPLLKALKKRIRLQPDKVQCQEIRKALPGCLGWERFVEAWKPCDLILTSRLKVRDRAQKLLFERHEEYFPDTSVPLLYRPEDTRRQDIKVTIPGPLLLDGRPDQRELVLNDVVEVPLKYAREVLAGKWGPDWALGYALTVHSSQGLTIHDPQKVWIVDDFLQWSNLAYLAVSRVEYLSQLERVVCPPEEGSEGAGTLTEQQLRKVIQRKLVAYKRQDAAKGLRFNLKVDHILELKEAQSNRCAACNIELLWVYQPKDTQQFSVDRLDNTMGHTRDNTRLTCLECNRKRGYAVLNA
ncbi:MAG: AAA family ATPase [Candidatus Thiodiazotropha sp.]